MSAVKERILGAVTIMDEDDAQMLWNIITETFGSGWGSIEEVMPDGWGRNAEQVKGRSSALFS